MGNLSLKKEGHFLALDHSAQCFCYEDALRQQESVSQETWLFSQKVDLVHWIKSFPTCHLENEKIYFQE